MHTPGRGPKLAGSLLLLLGKSSNSKLSSSDMRGNVNTSTSDIMVMVIVYATRNCTTNESWS